MKKIFVLLFSLLLMSPILVFAEENTETKTNVNNNSNQQIEQTDETETQNQEKESTNIQDDIVIDEGTENNKGLNQNLQLEPPNQTSTMDYVWIGAFVLIVVLLLISYFKDNRE